MPSPDLIRASDHSLLVHFGGGISLETHEQVLSLLRRLQSEVDASLQANGSGRKILNFHPAYNSLLISFNPMLVSHEEITHSVHKLLEMPSAEQEPPQQSRHWEIPVCYGGDLGPDLADVAQMHKMSEKEVVFFHSRAAYRVYFLGFSPGFAYLGGLPSQLATPRLETPRKHVAAGSVAIGGEQAGIYPVDSPGGWRLIGHTPERLFMPELARPTLFSPGDTVRFVPITREKWTVLTLGKQAAA